MKKKKFFSFSFKKTNIQKNFFFPQLIIQSENEKSSNALGFRIVGFIQSFCY